MAYTTIADSSTKFQTALYTGNGSTAHDITNTGNANLQPDLIWIKNRSASSNPIIQDTTRGINVQSFTDGTAAETTNASWGHVNSVSSDGFQVDAGSPVTEANANKNSNNYAGWQWKANAGTTSTNSNGSVTSYVQADTTAGFSIVKWTGNATGNFTVGHGLSSAPNVIVVKKSNGTSNWYCRYAAALNGNNSALYWNATNAEGSESTIWNSTAPTSTVFTIGTDGNLATTSNYIAYCWNSIKGYSAFGNYQGDGIASGPYIYTGFRPAFILIKNISISQSWIVFDSKRPGYNRTNQTLNTNEQGAEETGRVLDICSTGFKIRSTNTACNGDNNYHVYMAFADQPLVSSGVTNNGFA
tara:strand:- start:763 stop:1833 length:1071 start_codon:yes stop_codon:yes gene_type:complete